MNYYKINDAKEKIKNAKMGCMIILKKQNLDLTMEEYEALTNAINYLTKAEKELEEM